jgi:RNA exonuclease 1
VGQDTIVVGHGILNDMRALRWIHASVVDSFVLESKRLKSKEMEKDGEKEPPMQEDSQVSGDATGVSRECQSPTSTHAIENDTTSSASLERPTQNQGRARRPGNRSLKTLAKKVP